MPLDLTTTASAIDPRSYFSRYLSPMSKKNLLICFDAFGTLFKPRQPIAKQYAEVATALGLRDISEDAVEKAFKNGMLPPLTT